MAKKRKKMSKQRLTGNHLDLSNFLLASFGAVLIGGCGFLVDHLFHKANRLLASDFYTVGVAFLFSYVLLQFEARRRASLARRMEISAEVNHHIRNALTGVVFTAAASNDPALNEVLQDATARIDWVLNTVLPDGAADLKWPVQSSTWSPGSWDTTKEPPKAGGSAVPPKENV